MRSNSAKSVLGFAFIAFGLILAVIFLYVFLSPDGSIKTSDADASPLPVVVIDAGHGGRDGGATGTTGVLEKQLNLEISEKLCALLKICGYNVVMTRTEDIMLSSSDGLGSAKMQDLKARLEISSKYPDELTVSIHCNKFPSEKCKGLQVYYSDSDAAKNAADSVQSSVKTLLQKENHRVTKKADSSIYLLYRAQAPSILIECGFLSNPEDCENLSSHEYQKALALCILNGMENAKKES